MQRPPHQSTCRAALDTNSDPPHGSPFQETVMTRSLSPLSAPVAAPSRTRISRSLILGTALLGCTLFAAPARAQGLTPEQIQKVKALYKDATSEAGKEQWKSSTAKFKEILAILPNRDASWSTVVDRIADNFAKQSQFDEANAFLRAELAKMPTAAAHTFSPTRAGVLFHIGVTEAHLGKKDDALEALRRAVDHGFSGSHQLESEPALADVRGHPKFKQLVESANKVIGTLAFDLDDLTGKKLKREDYEGKVLVIDIWGTWCPPCRAEIPHFIELQKAYADQGFSIIGLTWERREADASIKKNVKRFAAANKINYPLAFATEERIAAANVQAYPTTLFIGRDGRLKDRIVGLHSLESLRAKILPLLKQKAPAKKPAAAAKAKR